MAALNGYQLKYEGEEEMVKEAGSDDDSESEEN